MGKLHMWEGHPNPTRVDGNEELQSVEERIVGKEADGVSVLVWVVENIGALGKREVEWAGRAQQEPCELYQKSNWKTLK